MKVPCSPLTRNSLSTNIQPKGSFSPGVLSQFGRHFEDDNTVSDINETVPNGTREDDQNSNSINSVTAIITTTQSPALSSSLQENNHLLTTEITPCKNFPLFLTLTIRSLGIIFGDIGTSPLYVLNTIFDSQPSKKQCIGAISLIIWDLIIIVSIKYGIFILMADNDGEGGTFALCALLTGENSQLGRRAKIGMTVVALAAASLLIGDGALTPAVSVLSAVQGLAVQAPDLQVWIVPITVVILVLLFIAQRWGTSKIGITFGPIMCIWFLSLFLIGIWQITLNPTILKAFDPWEALEFLTEEKQTALYRTSGVFLAVTGLEALYAGLGHFGRWPVRCSWFCIVFPGVLINYLGQGALLITDPSLIDNPFYHSVPKWAHWPMIVLSTVATIIASQAIITGSFSLISQAVGLKCSVPFQIVHTSKKIIGQIYVPGITYILMLLTITVTIASRTTSALKNAYGVTVCSMMIITTVLYMCVMRYTWQKPWYLVLAFGLFLIIDSYTLAANAIKIPAGGWIAIVIATGFFILGFCWFFGELNLHRFLKTHVRPTNLHTLSARLGFLNNNTHQNHQYSFADLPLMQTVDQIDFGNESDSNSDSDIDYQANKSRILPKVQNRVLLIKSVPRVSPNNIPSPFGRTDENTHGTIPVVITPCVGCFLTTSKKHTPHLFENFLAYMHAVPEVIIFLQIEHTKRPTIESNNRVIVKTYGKNIFHITALYGYSEYQITPFEILSLARTQYNVPIPNDEKKMTLFLPHETIKVSTTGWHSWIRRWPLYVYSVLKSLYPGASTNINVKMENTVSIGIVAKL